VATERARIDPQHLGVYEICGPLAPAQGPGGVRPSDNDVARMREIGRLVDAGLNLASVAPVLRLSDANDALRAELDQQDASRGGSCLECHRPD
jgi:MerR family transcriptional regulator, heat shock protein HspR